jgi:hypothetical protein
VVRSPILCQNITQVELYFFLILRITVLSDYLNAFLHSSNVTVKAAVLDDLLYSEILLLSPAEIVKN